MKTLKLLSIALAFLCCGCISSINHFGNENNYPYRATCEVWNQCICVWWNPPTTIESTVAMGIIEFTYLFWVVDLPLEVIEDTLFLPWDVYKYSTLKKSREVKRETYFWETDVD